MPSSDDNAHTTSWKERHKGAIYGVKSFFTGMVSAQVAALCTNPIDVIKIRLQIQGEGVAAKDAVTDTVQRSATQPATRRGLLGMIMSQWLHKFLLLRGVVWCKLPLYLSLHVYTNNREIDK